MGKRCIGEVMGVAVFRDDPEFDVPRRADRYRMTRAELKILSAVQEVELVGADPLLTDAVVLLQQARDKVADYVDAKRGS